MDTAWIQVFVLTLSECLAPAGKTICQEQEMQLQFTTEADCELAKEQLVSLMDRAEDVIVNREKTHCAASARQQTVFATQEEVRQQSDTAWTAPASDEDIPLDFAQQAHQVRLENLPACEEVDGTTPCKIGDIIIEGASERQTEVWRKE
ncbi:MAG: hypothetical protein GXP15_13960 [Gammaproteobacteria bacterium]|nr:hypothetical protein [Gammaproteobacteria bacterium]